ncbi:MAG: Wzz/FepE/Etk N-terminal domain-containing protein [Gammaproteobacteria bacterium]|nr:Wzz/FepE/Etk N-terminal domain-containing protein [Gammaproteobacteria bacterium]
MKRNDLEQSAHNIPQMYAPYYDDEISLVDLWLVLVRHKKVLFYVFIASLLLALAVVVLKKKQYEFVSVIEIGRLPAGNGYEYVATLDSLKAKLEQGYIPFVLGTIEKEERGQYKSTIEVPKGAHLLTFKTKNTEDNKQLHQTFHSGTLSKLIDDTNLLVESYKDKQASNLLIQKQSLEKFIKTQTLQLERVNQKIKDAEADLSGLKKSMNGTRVKKESVSLRSAEIAELYTQLADMTEKMENTILQKKTQIADIELNIQKVIPTRSVVPFYQSNTAKGLSSKILFVLIVFVGAIFALIAAFIAEFADKVREKLKQQEQESA